MAKIYGVKVDDLWVHGVSYKGHEVMEVVTSIYSFQGFNSSDATRVKAFMENSPEWSDRKVEIVEVKG